MPTSTLPRHVRLALLPLGLALGARGGVDQAPGRLVGPLGRSRTSCRASCSSSPARSPGIADRTTGSARSWSRSASPGTSGRTAASTRSGRRSRRARVPGLLRRPPRLARARLPDRPARGLPAPASSSARWFGLLAVRSVFRLAVFRPQHGLRPERSGGDRPVRRGHLAPGHRRRPLPRRDRRLCRIAVLVLIVRRLLRETGVESARGRADPRRRPRARARRRRPGRGAMSRPDSFAERSAAWDLGQALNVTTISLVPDRLRVRGRREAGSRAARSPTSSSNWATAPTGRCSATSSLGRFATHRSRSPTPCRSGSDGSSTRDGRAVELPASGDADARR